MQTRKRHPLTLVPNETTPVERRSADRRRGEVSSVDAGATEKFRAVFECVSDALMTVDRDGKIDLVNPAAEELTGYIRHELVGQPLESISPKGKLSARSR